MLSSFKYRLHHSRLNVLLKQILSALGTVKRPVREMKAAINYLPNELLILIFKFAIDSSQETAHLVPEVVYVSSRRQADTSEAVKITHICRRWRDVATGCPLLWTTVDDRHPDQVRELVQRSGGLPISLVEYA